MIKPGVPVKLVCRTLKISRSAYYRWRKNKPIPLTEKYRSLKRAVRAIIRRHPKYGYRRILDDLDQKDTVLNHKTLKKLLKIWHFELLRKRKKPRASGIEKILKDLKEDANLVKKLSEIKPFQVIYTDFTKIQCLAGTFQLIPFSDHLTKRIIGWSISPHADTANALAGYRMAKKYLHRKKISLSNVIIHQDQGTPFKSYEYVGALIKDGISPSYCLHGARDNPFTESVNGHFKEEYLDELSQAKTFEELKSMIKKKVRDWNSSRIHSALKGRNPDKFIRDILKI